jgi:hypothetical protein
MKKLIILSAFALATVIAFNSCEKSAARENTTVTEKLDIDSKELNRLLNEMNSQEKIGPGWWEKVKKWVNSHSGSSQVYVNGQPTCFGSGGCGPCAGICFSSGISQGGENGEISEEELSQGLKPMLFTLFEKKENNVVVDRKLVIEIPSAYVSAFVMNGKLTILNDSDLPDFFASAGGFTTVTAKAGQYATTTNQSTGTVTAIVNVSVK